MGIPKPVKRKLGRSSATAYGQVIHLNGGPATIEAAGKKLHPAHKSNGITNTWVKADGVRLSIGFTQDFGNDPGFLPAVFKIGLNLVAYFRGPEVAASEEYDHIRAFVWGEPHASSLTVAMDAPEGAKKGTGNPREYTKEGRPYPIFQVEILGIFFLIDMAPDQSMLRDLRGAATLMGQPLYVFPLRNTN